MSAFTNHFSFEFKTGLRNPTPNVNELSFSNLRSIY